MQLVMNDTLARVKQHLPSTKGVHYNVPRWEMPRTVSVSRGTQSCDVNNCPQEMVVTMQVQDGAVALCGTKLNYTCKEYKLIECDVVVLLFQLLAWGRTVLRKVRKWVIQ